MPEHKRGGPGRGQGRKPLSRDEPTVPVVIRMTESQRDTLLALGGAKWVRNQIEKAGIESGHFVRSD